MLFLIVTALNLRAADHIVWYPKARTFDLEVRNMPVEKFLGLVRAETGWEVMIEPGLKRVIGGEIQEQASSGCDEPAAGSDALCPVATRGGRHAVDGLFGELEISHPAGG